MPNDPMHDDDPTPDPICRDCYTAPCICDDELIVGCDLSNPEICESCQ